MTHNEETTINKYEILSISILALKKVEQNAVTTLSNIIYALKYSMDWFWTGLNKVEGNYLFLFLFQSPVACIRIKKHEGVCKKLY